MNKTLLEQPCPPCCRILVVVSWIVGVAARALGAVPEPVVHCIPKPRIRHGVIQAGKELFSANRDVVMIVLGYEVDFAAVDGWIGWNHLASFVRCHAKMSLMKIVVQLRALLHAKIHADFWRISGFERCLITRLKRIANDAVEK